MSRLLSKTCIITGAASGMGECHARLMAANGANVVLTDVQVDNGRAIAADIGGAAIFIEHDVSSGEDWTRVIGMAEDRFGPVNVLVNNAAIVKIAPLLEITEEVFDRTLEVNAKGTFLGIQAVVPSMERAGGGSIINISSIAGRFGSRNAAHYSASKFAVTGLTKSAAVNLGPKGIRVNSVHPGLVETPMLLANRRSLDEQVVRVPLGRAARADETSYLVVFLASDESSYCTGAEFTVDGGLSCFT